MLQRDYEKNACRNEVKFNKIITGLASVYFKNKTIFYVYSERYNIIASGTVINIAMKINLETKTFL